MIETYRWETHGVGRRLKLTGIEVGALGPEDVEFKVDYCFLCYPDNLTNDNDRGMSRYWSLLRMRRSAR